MFVVGNIFPLILIQFHTGELRLGGVPRFPASVRQLPLRPLVPLAHAHGGPGGPGRLPGWLAQPAGPGRPEGADRPQGGSTRHERLHTAVLWLSGLCPPF